MKILLFLACCLSLSAQAIQQTGGPATMLVHGEATVSVEPDIAEIDIGIITQGATSQAAADQNTAKSQQVIDRLAAIVPRNTIKTINLSVNPNYRYAKEGGSAVILGYTATNTVRLTLEDLSRLPHLINTATQAGASNINRLTFDLKEEKVARAQALAKAADQARSGADALASSLQLHIGRLVRVEEVQPVVISPAREIEISALKEGVSEQESISPGTIQIHASVNLIFAVLETKTTR